MKRNVFFDNIRPLFRDKKLNQAQVTAIELILDEWQNSSMTDSRHLAYMFATVFHETAQTMQAIEEYGKGKKHAYGQPDPITKQAYYGRGLVQLTFKANYQTFTKVLKVDLVNHPELALDPTIAVKIMFHGMQKGSFTGKKLSDYLNDTKEDWINARRIINILDRAEDIAGYAKKFYAAIQEATKVDFSDTIHSTIDFSAVVAGRGLGEERGIITSDKQTGLELRITKVIIKDNLTMRIPPFPGLANFYTLAVVIDDINPMPQTLEVAGFAHIGDNEMLPINRTIYTWLPKGEDAVAPSQVHVFFTIIKSKENLRKFGRALETLKQSTDFSSLTAKVVEMAASGGSAGIVAGISQIMGLLGNILGKVEDKPMITIAQSFTSLGGDFDKVGDFSMDFNNEEVDCSLRLFVRDASRK